MRARIVLLVALLLGESLAFLPVGAAVQTVAATAHECVYADGHFTGDCFFVSSPGGQYVCDVSYVRGIYTQGCLVTPFRPGVNAPHFAPDATCGGADTYAGGFYCPAPQPTPGTVYGIGSKCVYDAANENYDCKGAGPPGDVNDCVIETSTGVDTVLNCKKSADYLPGPSPSPSGDPCTTGGNLLCNADFSSPEAGDGDTGQNTIVGKWLAYSGVNTGYYQYSDGHDAPGSFRIVTGNDGVADWSQDYFNHTKYSADTRQNFVLPATGGGWLDAVMWHKAGPGPANGSCFPVNLERVSDGAGLWAQGLGGTNCAGAGWVSYHIRWAVPASSVPVMYRVRFANIQQTTTNYIVDDVVLLYVPYVSEGPSPSPSPSPGGGSEGGKPGNSWNCQDDPDDATKVNCTAPKAGDFLPNAPGVNNPAISNCVDSALEGHYTCQGPTPAPAPSGSPSPGPSGSLGPVRYGPSPGPSTGPSADSGKPCQRAEQILAARIAQGVPYCWGSRDPSILITAQGFAQDDLCPTGYGLDCSGAIIWAYRQAGIDVPNMTAQDMYNQLPHVACTLADLDRGASDGGGCWAVGDLIFLARNGGTGEIYHVAGYAGGNLWTDCFNTSFGCRVWDIRAQGVYAADFKGAARPSLAWGGEQCGDGGTVGGVGSVGAAGGQGASVSSIATALQPLYQKEPAGMLLDTVNYMRSVGASFQSPDTSVVSLSGASIGGPAAPAFAGVSGAAFMGGVTWFIDWLANWLEGASYGPINGLLLVRLAFDLSLVVLLFVTIRRSVVVTA